MALPSLPATHTPNFDILVRAVFDAWVAGIEAKAEGSHTHGAGGVVISIVANEAALGTGSIDGESKITADTLHRWAWDETGSAWTDLDEYVIRKAGVESGLILSVGTDADHDIDISAGTCVDSTGLLRFAVSACTRQIDAALGTGNGGLSSSLTVANNTVYRVFGLSNADGSTTTVGIDTSDTAANLLADHTTYTNYCFIGFVTTNGSANIYFFTMSGNSVIFPYGSIQTNTGIDTTYTAMSAGSWLPLSRTSKIFWETASADNRHRVRPTSWATGYFDEIYPNYAGAGVRSIPNNGQDIKVAMNNATPTGTFYLAGCELIR